MRQADIKQKAETEAPIWSAVLSMSLCVAMLIASEFMPVSLLTPMAAGLEATEGQTGQAISISGFFAVVSSLITTTMAGQLNRKTVLLLMTLLMLISLVMVATASNFTLLVIARGLLGVSIGSFWALSTAVIMRLAPPNKLSKALAVMYTGQAIAAAFAAPVGSYLGGLIGWRGAFWVLVPIAVINFVWQWLTLPSLPAAKKQSMKSLLSLLLRPYFTRGLIAVMFSFAGAFAMFTYLRPFLENVTKVGVDTLTLLFLILGTAGFIGTWAGGKLSAQHVERSLKTIPLIMALATLALLGIGHLVFASALFLAIWGVMNTAMPISWMAWLSQNIDDRPEAAGSLIVAAIQAAILIGAALGGYLLDAVDINATFIGSIVLSIAAALVIGSGKKILRAT